MTALGLFLAGLVTGAVVVQVCWLRWAEQHHYRRVRLETTRVEAIYRDKDHHERLARRWEHRAVEAREQIGDLVLQLHRTRRRRRSPVPVYGTHRQQAHT